MDVEEDAEQQRLTTSESHDQNGDDGQEATVYVAEPIELDLQVGSVTHKMRCR